MPHAVLAGPIDLHRYAAAHERLEQRDAQGVHALGGIYVAPDGRRALVEASSQTYGRTRRYLLALQQRGSSGQAECVVGLAEVEGPAITPGVLRLLEALVRSVLAREPGARIERTNLAGLDPNGT
ncbi:MAG: hypothetical protein IPN34_20660 [Planctomycetes bacterium]|nr:hypothetical protein [Planctomycetota bacterium]